MATKATKATAKPAAKTPVLKTEVKPAAEKKVETKVEKKVEAKPPVKPAAKPAAKAEKPAVKPAAKKTAAKKTAAKPIKTNLTIEFAGKSKTEEEIVKLAKKAWKKSGKKMADIKTIDAFVQPENNCVYCVVNGEELGAISLDGEM